MKAHLRFTKGSFTSFVRFNLIFKKKVIHFFKLSRVERCLCFNVDLFLTMLYPDVLATSEQLLAVIVHPRVLKYFSTACANYGRMLGILVVMSIFWFLIRFESILINLIHSPYFLSIMLFTTFAHIFWSLTQIYLIPLVWSSHTNFRIALLAREVQWNGKHHYQEGGCQNLESEWNI